MKIAFLSLGSGAPWGGSDILWSSTARLALKHGHEVLISVYEWPSQPDVILQLKKDGATFVFRRRFYPGINKRIIKKLANYFLPVNKKITYHQYINKFNPDVILFNLAGGNEIVNDENDLMLFINQTSTPFFVFYHSISQNSVYKDNIKDNFRLVFSKSVKSLFTSKMQMKEYEEKSNFKLLNGEIINHPLRKINIEPLKLGKGASIRFCVIGSLVTRWKGQDNLIKMFGREKWLKRNWSLDLYGDGTDRSTLETLIREQKISDRVFIKGHSNDINKILSDSHLVIIPSKQDSGPVVLFEALKGGRPVVGTNMGAIPDYVITDQTGVLAQGLEVEDLDNAMEFAWQQKESWPEWGRKGKELLKQKYDFNSDQTLLNYLMSI